MSIVGTKALADDAENNLEINGRISLNLLNLANTDIFFAGLADVNQMVVSDAPVVRAARSKPQPLRAIRLRE